MQFVLAEVSPSDFKNGSVEGVEGIEDVRSSIAQIIAIVQWAAGGIAVIALAITGIQFMGVSDPYEKKRLADRIKYILVGIVIVALSIPIVDLIV